MGRPKCGKCGGWLQQRDINVLENTATTKVTSCIQCGNIEDDRIVSAKPLRELDVDSFVHPGIRKDCKLDGCTSLHYGKGFCYRHYRQDFKRRAQEKADQMNARPAPTLRLDKPNIEPEDVLAFETRGGC